MSELSDKKATVTESLGGAATLGGDVQAKVKPVTIWATLGGAILVFQIYVWIRWITGPYFTEVPSGPDDPPMYMKAFLTMNAVVVCVGLPIAIWWFIVRPWRRERRITLDGMLLGSMGLMFFQDPFLNYINTWCTYNTWLWNRGSWTSNIPGWVSPEEPGRQVAEPLLVNAAGYTAGVLIITIAGCWVMRKIKARWPGMSNLRLILATSRCRLRVRRRHGGRLPAPVRAVHVPGANRSLSVFADTYHQYPIYEGLMWGAVQTAVCCLRYFTDDRGRTIVERGIDHVRGGACDSSSSASWPSSRRSAVASSSCTTCLRSGSACMPTPGPRTHEASYFTGGICGDGTDMPCPDPYCRCQPSAPAISTSTESSSSRRARSYRRWFRSNRGAEDHYGFGALGSGDRYSARRNR